MPSDLVWYSTANINKYGSIVLPISKDSDGAKRYVVCVCTYSLQLLC